MVKEVIISGFLVFILCSSCNDSNTIKEKELELRERELKIREKELLLKESNDKNVIPNKNITQQKSNFQNEEVNNTTKYVYVLYRVKHPILEHTPEESIPSHDMFSITRTIPEMSSVYYEDFVYTSGVEEIKGYSENKSYRFMDEVEKNVLQRISTIDLNFEMEVITKVRDQKSQSILKENKAKIVDRKIKVFNSYKEASKDRSRNDGIF